MKQFSAKCLYFFVIPSLGLLCISYETTANWAELVCEEVMPHMKHFNVDHWLSLFVLRLLLLWFHGFVSQLVCRRLVKLYLHVIMHVNFTYMLQLYLTVCLHKMKTGAGWNISFIQVYFHIKLWHYRDRTKNKSFGLFPLSFYFQDTLYGKRLHTKQQCTVSHYRILEDFFMVSEDRFGQQVSVPWKHFSC